MFALHITKHRNKCRTLFPLNLNLLFLLRVSGLYGHSAVYHEQTDAIYVFGGYRFHVETVEPSGELYSLYYPNLTWSLLVPSQGNKVRDRSHLLWMLRHLSTAEHLFLWYHLLFCSPCPGSSMLQP